MHYKGTNYYEIVELIDRIVHVKPSICEDDGLFVTFGRLINAYHAILMLTTRTKQNLVPASTGIDIRICAHIQKPDL